MMLLTALRRPRIQPTLPLPEINAISMRVLVCATQLDRKRKTYAGRNVSFYTLSDQPLPVTIGEYSRLWRLTKRRALTTGSQRRAGRSTHLTSWQTTLTTPAAWIKDI
jgi:hypothetical protein